MPAVVAEALAAAAARHGTPAYVYDLARVRATVRGLADVLPPRVQLRYSVKANPAALVCQEIAASGAGAEVSSAGELETALEAGISPGQILVSGPYKEPGLLRRLDGLPEVLISVDSLSELSQFAARPGPTRQIVLRLRPDYPSAGEMCEGPLNRFGIDVRHLDDHAASLARAAGCVGFHVYGGSQILDPAAAARNLTQAGDLVARAGAALGVAADVINVGGGFGVPYHEDGCDLDLALAVTALRALTARTPGARLALELGRYLVAGAGWYLTTVVHHQILDGRTAVVVDGGTHHRPDLCGLDLAHRAAPPLLLRPHSGEARPTAILGCLCLPGDVLAYDVALPPLRTGDVLAFPNAGAYGLTAAPHQFLSHRPPAEIVLDGGTLALPRRESSQSASPAGMP
jgi:diaminopimelate decarboxylase